MLYLNALQKHYGAVVALDGCTMRVPAGRVVGFLGPNGSGKTTAMRCIFGLVRPDEGDVQWEGAPVTPLERLRFGYMPEQRGLYPRMPIHDQLVYFARLHGISHHDADVEATRWLDRLGLADRHASNLDELSHGNQQRVQLAAALVHRPELIVLDEPFSGLDPLAVNVLAEVIREEARRGAAVVFSSHQLDLVEDICEDVAIIHRGKMVMSGELRELRDGAPDRFIEVATADVSPASWLPSIEGLEVIEAHGDEALIRVPAGVQADVVLAAARRAGHVRYFRYEPPTLARLFLEAVGQ